MLTLTLKMLFRRGRTAQSILAIALLVAILASTNAIVNHLCIQAEALGRLVNPGVTYVILSRDSTSVIDSQVRAELASIIGNLNYTGYVFPQKVLTANLTINGGKYTVRVRGVGDISGFLKARRAYLNGAVAKNWSEANAGELLARTLSINIGDKVCLTAGDRHIEVKVVGIFRSHMQSDIELLVPIEATNRLVGSRGNVSIIEFSLRGGVDRREAISKIMQLLPENVKLVQTQQLKEFLWQMNAQTLKFLNVWSMAVYAVVAAASYINATRLITESSYELSMLRAIGAKKRIVFVIILAYTATTAFLGSTLGISLGTAGAQIASTALRWIRPSVDITPFLKAEQALKILLLTLASSIIGCMYPAFRYANRMCAEQPL